MSQPSLRCAILITKHQGEISGVSFYLAQPTQDLQSFTLQVTMSEMPSITPEYAAIISKVLQSYKDKYGLDLNYMKFIEDPTPRFNNGKKVPETLGIVPGGSWTKHKKIYLAPDMEPAMKAYGVTEDKNKFIARIIAHELGHEVYNNSPGKDRLRAMIASKIAEDNFNTAYLDSVKSDKMEEEAFAEYLANNLVNDL